jgi:hypothetical protein
MARECAVLRVAEDDPDSGLYAESSDAGTVIGYITTQPYASRRSARSWSATVSS